MRPAPPLRVSVDRFGVWRTLVLAIMVTVAATVTAWLLALHDDAALGRAGRVVVAAIVTAGLLAAATLLRQPPFDLRWDGQRWHLDEAPGRLRIALDAGAWLLLRFEPEDASARWLPVQRSALPHAWHALRCAVYSPRPGNGDPSLDSPDSASTPPTRPG